jgi:hypothetical protein
MTPRVDVLVSLEQRAVRQSDVVHPHEVANEVLADHFEQGASVMAELCSRACDGTTRERQEHAKRGRLHFGLVDVQRTLRPGAWGT